MLERGKNFKKEFLICMMQILSFVVECSCKIRDDISKAENGGGRGYDGNGTCESIL